MPVCVFAITGIDDGFLVWILAFGTNKASDVIHLLGSWGWGEGGSSLIMILSSLFFNSFLLEISHTSSFGWLDGI